MATKVLADPGFPVTVTMGMEAIVLDKDTTGRSLANLYPEQSGLASTACWVTTSPGGRCSSCRLMQHDRSRRYLWGRGLRLSIGVMEQPGR